MTMPKFSGSITFMFSLDATTEAGAREMMIYMTGVMEGIHIAAGMEGLPPDARRHHFEAAGYA